MQDAEVIQGLADAAGSLEPTGLAAVSRRNDKWEAEGPLPTPLLPPPTGAAIYGEQGEGCMAADCSTPGSGPAPAKAPPPAAPLAARRRQHHPPAGAFPSSSFSDQWAIAERGKRKEGERMTSGA
uniref:Uncharacterized protein n=1 Tax=Setaria viridis TaxID=4556 RepID=A0A4U6WFH5_SETVI|nr:hypothetical protein SEVIR_1G248000v2 [Setaria viridis]